jgi:hypothetical protein
MVYVPAGAFVWVKAGPVPVKLAGPVMVNVAVGRPLIVTEIVPAASWNPIETPRSVEPLAF